MIVGREIRPLIKPHFGHATQDASNIALGEDFDDNTLAVLEGEILAGERVI